VLRLALHQLEDGTVQQAAERVVVEFTHWHLVHLLIIVFDELLEVLEHLIWVAAAHDFSVLVSLRLRLRLHFRVELNLRLELLVRLLFISREEQADLLEDSAPPEHVGEGTTASLSPKLLMVFSLLNIDFFQRVVCSKKSREALQTIVCQYSNIEALNVDVAVASLNDAAKANRLEADALEGNLFDLVVRVGAQGYTDVLTSLRGEVVTIELQLCDVLAVLFFKQWSQVKGCQVREII